MVWRVGCSFTEIWSVDGKHGLINWLKWGNTDDDGDHAGKSQSGRIIHTNASASLPTYRRLSIFLACSDTALGSAGLWCGCTRTVDSMISHEAFGHETSPFHPLRHLLLSYISDFHSANLSLHARRIPASTKAQQPAFRGPRCFLMQSPDPQTILARLRGQNIVLQDLNALFGSGWPRKTNPELHNLRAEVDAWLDK